MATRFYLESSGTPHLNALAVHSGWFSGSVGLNRLPMNTTKASTTLTDFVNASGGASKEFCVFQFQSTQQLAAQTISNAGTFNGLHRCLEAAATANVFAASVLYVVSSDGATIRGTIYDDTLGNSDIELGTTASTRVNPSDAFVGTKTSVVAVDGDYLIFELGFSANATGVSQNVTQRVGSSAASDFALTSGLTTDLNPWLELSATLTFLTATNNNRLMTMGSGT
jgi:hypothetical protein